MQKVHFSRLPNKCEVRKVSVEDVAPGIHTMAHYGLSGGGWAGPMTPNGIHTGYLMRKTS